MKKFERGYAGVGGGFCRAAVVAAAVLSVNCSGQAGDAGQAPLATDASDVLVQTIHVGQEANILVQVEPNSVCKLHTPASDDIAVYGDARGVAAFFASLDTVGITAEMSLECSGPHLTGTKTYPVTVTSIPDDEPTSEPTAWLDELPYPGRSAAPLLVDPAQVTAAQLASLHLPAKPDPVKMPQAYASWLERVTTASVAVDAELVDTGIVNDISPYRDYENTWCGYDVSSYQGLTNQEFVLSFSNWTVPRVTGPTTGKFYSSIWTGLGGFENTYKAAMPQTGTEQEASCSRFGTGLLCTGTYYAWVEYYPAAEQRVTNFTVKAGDTITAEVSTDSNGTATLYLNNTTRIPNTSTQATLSVPSNSTFYADSAEWIVERPLVSGTPTSLAKFADIPFTGVGAMVYSDQGQVMFNFNDPNAFTGAIDMINGTNGHALANALAPTDWGAFAVHWTGSN